MRLIHCDLLCQKTLRAIDDDDLLQSVPSGRERATGLWILE